MNSENEVPNEVPNDTLITITISEHDHEPCIEYSLCDYICFFVLICLILGLIYIIMLCFYSLYRIMEIISIYP